MVIGLLYQRTTCNIFISFLFLQLMGVEATVEQYTAMVTNNPVVLVVMQIGITVAIVLYVMSSLVLVFREGVSKWGRRWLIRPKKNQVLDPEISPQTRGRVNLGTVQREASCSYPS